MPAKSIILVSVMGMLGGVGQSYAAEIEKELPKNRTLKIGQVVFVENDGRCEEGQVLKVTGGNKSKGIKRQVECVQRPQ